MAGASRPRRALQVATVTFPDTDTVGATDALERFVELVADAVAEKPRRKRTRTPTKARRKRLEAKRRRSENKALRGPVDHD